ncbi:MAG: TIGR04255 family protein [Acidobacteriota bacterium]|nr:TIGR04255 family protein [Acidobacteriota bacterium]
MPRIYNKPPLIEALCEIKFAETEGDFTVWGDFYRKIEKSYPQKNELPRGIEFQFTPNESSINPTEFVKRFISNDNAQLVQATRDSLTLNRLSPYSGYEDFKKSFIKVLKIYAEIFSPKRFAQLSMRYVNQIIIPHEKFSVDDYFGLVPIIPEGVTDAISSMFIQVQIAPQVENHFLQATLRSVPSMPEGNSVFFLDIFDAFPINSEYDEIGILKAMDDAHKNVEHVFEKLIQERLREVFEEVKENG